MSGLVDWFTGGLAKATHEFDKHTNPQYNLKRERIKNEAAALQLVSGAGLAASAVALYLGMTRNEMPHVIAAGALAYVCYNMYRVGENYQKIAKNPNEFDSLYGLSEVVGQKKPDNQKLKKHLGQNTFYFGAFVDFIVKHVISLR